MKRHLLRFIALVILVLGAMPRGVFAQPAEEKPLDIVWVTAETKPFASTGGLGNVSQELPATFNELGHKTTVIMPLYHTIDPAAKGLVDTGLTFDVGSEKVKLWKGTTNGVEVYFLDNRRFFSGPRDGGIYVDRNEKDYKDSPGRWDFLSRASLEAMKKLGLKPDVIHANDHHTGALPFYADRDAYFERTLKVFEIHNAAYQGQVEVADIDQTELRRSGAFSGAGSPAEAWGKANPLKLGIRSSDVVLTVSPNYAKETMDWRFGAGMEGDLRERFAAGRYIGILNGTDATWNPARDPFIWQKYSRNTLDKKAVNKAELQRFYFGDAGVNAGTPFMGTVSRFTDQKGIDRIIHAVRTLAERGEKFQYVILGTADTKYAPPLEALARRYPSHVNVDTDFTVAKEHRMYAGLDGFLMPSNWEPSGLPQMYSERYGTIPIVSDVGGLVDSVKDYDPATGKGTGIVFRAEMGHTFWGMAKAEFDRILRQFDRDRLDSTTEGLKRAIDLFRSKDDWRRVQLNAMREENRWTKKAGPAYITTFRSFLEEMRDWGRVALGSTLDATSTTAGSTTSEDRGTSSTAGFSRSLDRGFDRASASDGLQSEAVRERIRQSRDRTRVR